MKITPKKSVIANNKEKILKLSVYLALFVSLIFPYRDKDWGWHYKYGEYFWETREVLTTDIFTWSMPHYAWVNHSWLFDPILYTLDNLFGFVGLSIINAIVVLGCFYLLTKDAKLNFWQLGILAFFFEKVLEVGIRDGLRSQSLALAPLAILLWLLLKGKENIRYLYWLPLLFFIWSNLHGSFVLGIAVTAVFLGMYYIQKIQDRSKLMIIGILSVAFSIFNPFTYKPYFEVLRHTNGEYLRNIYEWMPISMSCSYCNVSTVAVYVVLVILAVIALWPKFSLPFALLGIVIAWQAVMARRYIPIFGITMFPLVAKYMEGWKRGLKYLSESILSPVIFAVLCLVTIEYNLFNRLPSFNFYHYSERDYCYFASRCSVDLVTFLKTNPPQGRGFNYYDWGGYLIGKEFPVKIFVDGRMHQWKEKGYTAFGDYIEMYYRADVAKFNTYNFDWAIIEPSSKIAQILTTTNTAGGWSILYQDVYSLYLVRVK